MPIQMYQSNEGFGDLAKALVSAPAIYTQGRRQGQQMATQRAQDVAGIQKQVADARKSMLEAKQIEDQRGFQAGLPEDLDTLNAYQTGRQRLIPPPDPASAATPLESDVNASIGQNQELFASTAVPGAEDAMGSLANVLRGFGGNASQVTDAMMQGSLGSEAAREAQGAFDGGELVAALQAISTGQNLPKMFDVNSQGIQSQRYSPGIDESGQLAQANIGSERALAEQRLADEGTSLMQHAQAAGLQPGTPEYQEFIREGVQRPGVQITNEGNQAPQIGSIPQGWQAVPVQTPEGVTYRMEPIPGGPAEEELRQAEDQQRQRDEIQQRYADVVLEDIDRAKQIVNEANVPVTGFGSYLGAVPGTPARDLRGLVDTIRANVGFDRLQQMRDASPTGGALGQVSELENRLLQATLGNLEQSQSQDQFLHNLDRMDQIYQGIIHGVQGESGEVRPLIPQDVESGSLPPPAVEASGQAPQAGELEQVAAEARAAIEQGADPEAVRERLRQNGIDPAELGL